jgi:hypothetical protein
LTGQLLPPEEEEQEKEELSTGFGLYFVSIQPASSSHPQLQQYQGQRSSSISLGLDLQEAKQHSFLLIVCH